MTAPVTQCPILEAQLDQSWTGSASSDQVAGAGRSRVGGYTLTLIVALAQHWTPDVPPFAGAGGLAVATVIGVLAWLYPAMRAVGIEPAEALRFI